MKQIILINFIFFLLSGLCSGGRALAQNTIDVSTVNIDQLSDQQIGQLIQEGKAKGLNEDQLLLQAKDRGMSNDQLTKLRSRIDRIGIIQINKGTEISAGGTRRTANYQNNQSDTLRSVDNIKLSRIPVFGAELFSNKNNSFEPNLKLATPVNYIIGPEDELNINVYGNSVVNWQLEVSPEGTINIPGVGVVSITGKTIEQATALIKSRLASSHYAIGRGTDVKVSLGNIRSIKVIMIGQLNKPGTYTLPSLSTVFNALYSAGGPNFNGSFRKIEVIRDNRIIRHLDIYDFLTKADQRDNIGLRDQDIIRVPTYRTRVELSGQVKIPAIFEVLPGENLQDVIDFAGGFTDSAYTSRISVQQINDQQHKLTDVVEADYNNYVPLRGDRYYVGSIISRIENRVLISGAVFRPGEYELQKELSLYQLIQNAQGLKEDAFMSRGTLIRLKPDNTTEIISFNLKDVLNKVINIRLQREDNVHISSIFDLRDSYTVTINGEIRHPGSYAFAEGMKVADLVLQSGGLSEGASNKRIEVSRRINNADATSPNGAIAQVYTVDISNMLKSGEGDFALQPFDIVSIHGLPGYEKQRIVKIEGEVLYPGTYTITNKKEKISDLVSRAGGMTSSADISGGTLKRNNVAILGIDRNKTDTTALERDRVERLTRLNQSYRDTSEKTDIEGRNNFVGINLKAILEKPGTDIDLLIEDGDLLRIPKRQQLVRVNGAVLYPSAVVYEGNKSFNDFVSNAGGYSTKALRRGAYVVYSNGSVKSTRKFLFFNIHPSVRPGSEIYVPNRPESKGNSLQTVLGLTTGFASVGAVILGILSLRK